MSDRYRIALLYFVIFMCLGATIFHTYMVREMATNSFMVDAYASSLSVQADHIAKLDGRVERIAKQFVNLVEINQNLELQLEFSSIIMKGQDDYVRQLLDTLGTNGIPIPLPNNPIFPEFQLTPLGPQSVVPSGLDKNGNPVNPLEVAPAT